MELKISGSTILPTAIVQQSKQEQKVKQSAAKIQPQKNDVFVKEVKEKREEEQTFLQKVSNKIKPYKDKILIGLAVLTGIFIGVGSGKSKQKQLENQVRDLEQDKEALKNELDSISKPEDFDEQKDSLRNKILQTQLNYNPAVSPLGDKDEIEPDTSSYTDLPEKHIKTNNRNDIEPFYPPEFITGQDYFVHIPDSDEEVITHQTSTFKEGEMKTTITEDYADSVQWDSKKIARDLMQNFYDGHNQTLNGVDIEFKKQPNGKYKVRITGKSTYSPDKAVLLGESSKRDNAKAAGNYGEGLKMVVLKLLKDGKSDSVKIGSGDWKVNWTLEQGDLNAKKVLAYSLKNSEHFDGNYIEFETKDNTLLSSIVNSVNNFYYAGNSNFSNPDFENELFGFKILPDNQNGGIYIAGQEFEYDGDYSNIKGLTLFIKEKPPARYNGSVIFDPSRDRISLTDDNIEAISTWITKDNRTSKEDISKVLKALEPDWESRYIKRTPVRDTLLEGIIKGADSRNMKFKFPENCIADSFFASSGVKSMYSNSGYKLCKNHFAQIGMKNITELVDKDRKHVAIQPTEKELQKIKILREAISILSPVIKNVGFKTSELQPNIYIFNNSDSEQGHGTYSNVEGEAIVENGESKGFWLDRNQLNTKDFAGLLTTTLHEITHKFGSDESSAFSYKLTDVMGGVLKVAKDHPGIAIQLKALGQIWNEI